MIIWSYYASEQKEGVRQIKQSKLKQIIWLKWDIINSKKNF